MYTRIVPVLALFLACSVGGCSSPEGAMTSRLSSLMVANGYTLYTPFRTKDYPGTLFVTARNSDRRWTEFLVAQHSETFDAPAEALFDKDGKRADLADSLSETFKFSGGVGFELVSVVIKPELTKEYAREIKLSFGDPKVEHVMSMAQLEKLKSRLAAPTKQVLRDLKERGQIDYVYLVMQTLTVSTVRVEVTLKDEFVGKLALEKVKDIAKLDAKVSLDTNGTVVVESAVPLIIGYKAVRFPESLLRAEVSPPDLGGVTLIPAAVMSGLKD